MIPPVAHFVWLGRALPWMQAIALRAAALRGGFARVVLHHLDELDPDARSRCRTELACAELRRIRPDELFGGCGPHGAALLALWERLASPSARSNLLRAAILAREGGVYLDTDVITLTSFLRLGNAGAFCGRERIAVPVRQPGPGGLAGWLAPLARRGVWTVLGRLPYRHRWLGSMAGLYPAMVNSAVLGGHAGHPLLLSMLAAMVGLPPERQLQRFALGPQLLEDVLGTRPAADVVVHPPGVFYPLGPDIAHRWFRVGARPQLERELAPDTVAVHWYGSLVAGEWSQRIDADWVRAHAHCQPWSALVRPLLDEK